MLETPLCGRFTLVITSDDLDQEFDIRDQPEFEFESYNIAPSQSVPIIHLDDHHDHLLSLMQWGFLPSWAKTAKEGPRPINARLETVAENAMFKGSFHRRRCLIPATGFYEWDTKATPKQPYYFYQKDRPLFAFAGLWNVWEKDSAVILSFTMITKEAEATVKPVHDRMPLVLGRQDYDSWLKEATLPKHCPPLNCHPVSIAVNSPENNDLSLIV